MCLAIPAKVETVEDGDMAVVVIESVRKRISTALLDDVAVGEYVLIHVGYALHRLSEEEADELLMDARAALLRIQEIETSRSVAIAITKVEEALLWYHYGDEIHGGS